MQRAASSKRQSSVSRKAETIQDRYLSDQESGLASAIHDSLKSLFAEARLPDNPFYYLANILSAHVDRGALWQEPDAAIAAAVDADSGTEHADPASRLCRLSTFQHAWGLAHVLRVASKEGITVLHDVLTNSLPDSFFPGPMPFSAGDGCTVQVLASVQGTTALWRPKWIEFPELIVRADVVVRGPSAEAALGHFAALLESDLAELVEVPVYFVDSLVFLDPAEERSADGATGKRAAKSGASAAASAALAVSLEEMRAAPDEFRRTLQRCILSGCCVEVRGVVMLEAPKDAHDTTARKLRFESATKRYYLHYIFSESEGAGARATSDAATAAAPKPKGRFGRAKGSSGGGSELPAMKGTQAAMLRGRPSHYGSCATHEALYEGFFLDPSAARQYVALWAAEAEDPYSKQCLEANVGRLIDLIEASLRQGANMEGFRRALLLALLQDAGASQVPLRPRSAEPTHISPLEELLAPQRPGAMSEVAMVLSTVPTLLRMLNSGAADIAGVVREIQAVLMVARLWPPRRQQLIEQAEAAMRAGRAEAGAAAGGAGAVPQAGQATRRASQQLASGARRASQVQLQQRHASGAHDAEDATPQERLAWLHQFQMEAKLLEQLMQLGPRMRASSGSGILSGISTVLEELVQQLPASVPATAAECQAAISDAQPRLLALQHLMEAAELSLADGLLDRCRDVAWALHRFGIRLVDSVMERASHTALAEEGDHWAAPEWVLDVRAATEAQVRSGAVAERVAVEGVMLQYAVDAKLDELLSRMYITLTSPPLALNPYPRLVHMIRAHAARLDLWRDDVQEMCRGTLNRLCLLQPPAFIYKAQPPPRARRAPGARGVGGGGGTRGGLAGVGLGRLEGDEDDYDESTAAFGCYAAVTLCDCRALQALRASLGPLLSERSWQSGSYTADVVPALTGDAALSGALRLTDGDGSGSPWGGGAIGAGGGGAEDGLGGSGASNEASGARLLYEHPRFEGVEAEEHHLISGPSVRGAAALFAKGAVDAALALHHGSVHLLHALEVAEPGSSGGGAGGRAASSLLGGAAAALMGAAAAESPFGPGVGCMVFGLAELLTASGREEAARQLVEAVRLLPQGACVARVVIFAAVKEGVYVSLAKRLAFQHRGVRGPLGEHEGAAAAHGRAGARGDDDASGGGGGGDGGDKAGGERGHWDADVYRRVFLTADHALLWWRGWNDARGDPAQLFHYHHFVEGAQAQVLELERCGRLLDAQKLLLLAGCALQDVGLAFHASRAAHSAAQELRCLQRTNEALVALLSHRQPPEQRVKLDAERARRLFLLYCGRLRRAMRSPRYCYFSGFAAVVPRLISRLKERVLGSFRLGPEEEGLMAQLNLWTRCCEFSVAASVHACLDASLTRGLAARAE